MTHTNATRAPESDVTACLAQADLMLWLAGWLRPSMAQPDGRPTRGELQALIDATGLAEPHLFEHVATLHESGQATSSADYRHEHHRLFDAGIACPINESAYVRRDKGAIIGDVCGFYRAFGFQPAAESGDKPDHLACELEFVAMLLLLRAHAQQAGVSEQAQLTEQALADFASDHLDAWLLSFCSRLEATTRLPACTALAQALPVIWQAMSSHHGLLRAEGIDVSEPGVEPESPYSCGMLPASEMVTPATVELRVDGQPQPSPAPH
ncbi:MAG: molecular chaperone TorD family protein [Phycisphaeraceae bacterium]